MTENKQDTVSTSDNVQYVNQCPHNPLAIPAGVHNPLGECGCNYRSVAIGSQYYAINPDLTRMVLDGISMRACSPHCSDPTHNHTVTLERHAHKSTESEF